MLKVSSGQMQISSNHLLFALLCKLKVPGDFLTAPLPPIVDYDVFAGLVTAERNFIAYKFYNKTVHYV